jgi:hypothetical protein
MAMNDEQFNRQFAEATKRGEVRLKYQPRAIAVRYLPRVRKVTIELSNGSTFTFPSEIVEGIAGAERFALASVRVLGPGTAIEWPKLDVQLSVAELLNGVFGTRAWMKRLNENGAIAKAGPARSRKRA